jgi:hypothetical protein
MDKIEGRPITPEEAEFFYVIPKGVFKVFNTYLQKKIPYEGITLHKGMLIKDICEEEQCDNDHVQQQKWIKSALAKYREAEWIVYEVINSEGDDVSYEFKRKRDGPDLIPIKNY